MNEAGFEYVAVDYNTVRRGMTADKSLPGLSERGYFNQYGFGISTLYTGKPPQLADETTPAKIGLGEQNVETFQNLSPADQVAYNRTLFDDNLDATFAVAIETVFTPEQLSTTYLNPKDALIEQDPRMIEALAEFGECLRAEGFDYTYEREVESDLKERLYAITGGAPAEAAARTAPPTPSPLLVPVEERVLTSDVVTRGTARFGTPQSISLAPSPLKSDGGVITSLPPRNTQLSEGDVLLTASGRPVFVLQGAIPAFRDFVPGLSGDDVRQLEEALERLGFEPGDVDGTYDEQTALAVSQWYTAAGWEPFGATADQLATIQALEGELAGALNDKAAAADALAAAPLAVAAASAEAEAANMAAAAAVAAAVASAINTSELELAQSAALAVQLAGDVAVQEALDAQMAAEREAQTAAAAVDRITADLEAAQRAAGVKAPLDEIVFIPTLPVRVEQSEVVVGDEASGPVLLVTNNQLAIDSSLPLDEAPLVRPGMAVAIDEPDLGIVATGVVERVAGNPGSDGVDGFHIYFEVLVDETPATLEGFSLRLTIPVESTGGEVTIVPISALSLAADGTTRVQVEDNGTLEFVVVEPGLSADGFVEVTPLAGALPPGRLVVIGYEQ
jgi:peptidoglycan hydrolase-like protein with peptidoglycan-binding domain